MKLIVMSDTHGQTNEIINIINDINDADLVIHLGDYAKDAKKISEHIKQDIVYVKGNCDFRGKNTNEDEILHIQGKKIFLTHGHKYGIKYSLNGIYYKAKEINADIVLFGHSHVPLGVVHDDILFFNPGSPTIPRGMSKKSYGIIEINKKIDFKHQIIG
ncbi:YfcE family phosphodiesterase [Caldisalinibacter kiritimatiensis]|uniref:Phosphoesterase n=1 Tax=Caldisalinibacter kiritimatiensis TaxID=1304284 RepID=R1CHH8_9FIRM|nr:metallophosphoesterase [Caldisalinibacter kiritimatiensis]EOD01750.1 Phosphoesterase [Caldisalinibacter kiritimatiensis]